MKHKQLLTILCLSILAVFSANCLAKKTRLIVYTSMEADELRKFKRAFEKDNPDISLKWVRNSTGIMTAKLMAESKNPKADVVWGMATTSMAVLANQNYFLPYKPKGVGALEKSYVDTSETPTWVGQRAYIASVCFNTTEAKKLGLPKPKTWEDLTKDVYKGRVVMPNPNSSGTGFLDVAAWLQMWGEEKGWKYMEKLHQNIAVYTHSGSKPCRLAAAGEYPIGISFAFRGANLKAKGAPIDVIAPSEGLGWELESFAIVKGTKKLAAAQRLADWSVTKKANVLYNDGYAVVAMPGVAKPLPYFPDKLDQRLIKNDFKWVADNRKDILAKWQQKFGQKSEKN